MIYDVIYKVWETVFFFKIQPKSIWFELYSLRCQTDTLIWFYLPLGNSWKIVIMRVHFSNNVDDLTVMLNMAKEVNNFITQNF